MLLATAIACGGDDGASGLTVASPPATHARVEPRLALSASEVRQGGVIAVRVRGEGLREGVAQFGGRAFRLGQTEDGLWAAIAVAVDEPPGAKPLIAEFVDATGSPQRLEASVTVTAHDFPIDEVTLAPGTVALLDPELVAQEERLLQATLRGFTAAAPGAAAAFVRPVEGKVTTTFGEVRVYNNRAVARDHHRGMDIGADRGTPVVAAAGGIVALAQAVPVRGNYIVIDHGLGVFTGYGHLDELRVAKGDTVSAGQTIGLVGTSGLSTGPHLHWDAVTQGIFFDPQLLLDGALKLE